MKIPSDLEMIHNPDLWPAWPFLPLVKIGSKFGAVDSFGYLFNNTLRGTHDDSNPIVFIGSIYDESINAAEQQQKRYDTFEKLLEEWRVD